MKLRKLGWTTIVASGLVLGCKDDPLTPTQINAVSATDGQSAPAGARLATPIAVEVRAGDGKAVPRARVRWRVNGGGTVSDTLTLSDATGRAQVDVWLGTTPGSYVMVAELATPSARTATFHATATAAPTLSGVSPSSFTGGSTITLQGSGLSANAEVEIAGAPARVTGGSATSVTVIVPICLPPGRVPIRARVSGAYTNETNADYAAPVGSVTLGVGEYASIDPAQLPGCASFPAAGAGGAEYLLAPQATAPKAGQSVDYRLQGNEVLTVTNVMQPDEPPPTAAAAFHRFLRDREAELARDHAAGTDAVVAPAPLAAPAATIKVGDARTFRVCNKLTCSQPADFSPVESRAKFVGDYLAIFQDNSAPADGFTDAEYEALGNTFDDVLYDVDTRAFGVESDVDQNGVVFVLVTPVVNRLTPREQCQTSVITGFFYAIDIDPSYAADQRANQAEVFYTFAPDPAGANTCTLTKDQFRRIVPTTFVHEFQHMINFNQHALLRRGPNEALWLNEGLSHLAEELAAWKFSALNQPQAFSEFVIGDLYDGFQFLKSPGSYYQAFADGQGTLAERGANWLFLRWLVDIYGASITRRLSETRLTGEENIANATGEPVTRLLSQWFLANYVSDLNVTGFTPPPRLKYVTWSFRTTYASLNQQQPSRFDRPFPIVPQTFTGGAFNVTGTLKAGSGDYFRVVQLAGQRGFTVRLTDPSGLPLTSTLVPRLNVIRIR